VRTAAAAAGAALVGINAAASLRPRVIPPL